MILKYIEKGNSTSKKDLAKNFMFFVVINNLFRGLLILIFSICFPLYEKGGKLE
jgi:hypothetical protein